MSPSGIEKPAVSRKEMEGLKHDAAHARRRYDLYKSRNGVSEEASPDGRLKDLKRESEIAQMRLIRAKNA
jgi:hypothetical protein